jgi:hypothetical protein
MSTAAPASPADEHRLSGFPGEKNEVWRKEEGSRTAKWTHEGRAFRWGKAAYHCLAARGWFFEADLFHGSGSGVAANLGRPSVHGEPDGPQSHRRDGGGRFCCVNAVAAQS